MRATAATHNPMSMARRLRDVGLVSVVAACLVAVFAASPAVAAPAGGPVPSGFNPASVTFISAADGWVLGSAPCANPVCTSIVRTTDGGRTWAGVPAPTEKLSNDGRDGLDGLRFADANDGYAFGDSLWVTHDGGATWQQSALPSSGSRFAVQLAASNGFVYVLISPTSLPATAGVLYRSPVGSETWTSVLTVPAAVPANLGLDVHGDDVWVLAPGSSSMLFHSADDGATWSHSTAPCAGDFAVGPSASYTALGCSSDPGAGSATKTVSVSTDGGQTFAPTAAGPPRGGVSLSLAVAQPGNLVVASSSGASFLYATFDGGASWQTVLDSTTGGQAWHDLGFTTAQQGVAIEGDPATAPSQLWMTRDGGHFWQPITFASGPAVRLAGSDRYGTAVATSQAEFPSGGAGAVVLARGDQYADALVGAPLAAAKNAPLLLTTGTQLPAVTKAELQRVLATSSTVYVLGGTSAVPASVATQLTGLGYTVTRYGGTTRYATAVAVADALGDPSTVLLATGLNFPDALAAGPAAAKAGGVVLLTAGSALATETSAYLNVHGTTVYAIGGPAAAADTAAIALVGSDRYATAAKVATTFFSSPTTVGVATGENFPDALSGGAYLAHLAAPLVLADTSAVPTNTASYLQSAAASLTAADLFGGSAVLSAGVQAAIGSAIS
jgi:putative cell wall-binding protein